MTLLLVICFLLGVCVSAFLFSRMPNSAGDSRKQGHGALSDATRAVLSRLDSPVEIRFYSLLDPASVPVSLNAFADRVDALLSAYQQEGKGRIEVTRYHSSSAGAVDRAASDDLKPFNLEKGTACYLGIAVAQGARRELISQLSPEWEPALEFDLTRAIVRLTAPPPAPPVSEETAKIQAAAAEQVARAIPNLATVSLEEGTALLRQSAMDDLKAAASASESRLQEAQQRVLDAQNKSAAEQQAALKHLQQVQADQTGKIKEIAARLQNQIEALRRLKSNEPPSSSTK